jgi:glycosyltransferase involved in cell wall biosynthesis
MPVYNAKPYLGEALASILAQTCADFEFVIVDDGSTDGSAELVERCDDPRLVLLRNGRNLGIWATRNRCLEVARGEYAALMDADDRSAPDRFRVQLEYLTRHPELAAVGSWAQRIGPTGERLSVWRTVTGARELHETLLDRNEMAHGSAMVRTAAFRALGGYRPVLAEDYDLWLRLTDAGAAVDNLPECLYDYRVHPDSDTKQKTAQYEAAAFLLRASARCRRAGRSDPLAGLDYERFRGLMQAVQAGRGGWGRERRAAEDWARAAELWDEGDHWGALGKMARVLGRRPGYPPLWARLRQTLGRRLRLASEASEGGS